MGKVLLRLFSLETLISVVTELLASTVKNPQSPQAKRLLGVVVLLHRATDEFLTRVS